MNKICHFIIIAPVSLHPLHFSKAHGTMEEKRGRYQFQTCSLQLLYPLPHFSKIYTAFALHVSFKKKNIP